MNSKKEWSIVESMITGDFNENHDPDTGQFTSGSGGGSGSKSNSETVNTVNGLKITRTPGSKENYTVKLDATRSMKFRTQKAATEWVKAYTTGKADTMNANTIHALQTAQKDKAKNSKK